MPVVLGRRPVKTALFRSAHQALANFPIFSPDGQSRWILSAAFDQSRRSSIL
jgi:hypothetical protein